MPETLQATFSNPLISSVADTPDPWMVYQEGYYYYCLSWDNAIWVWKSLNITDIDRGIKVQVWSAPTSGPYSTNIWAPELHFLDDRWYIYFAADDGDNANHRMYVLESISQDPLGEYFMRGKISDPSDKWAIDGTVLKKADGSLYFIWSGWPDFEDGQQNLYIAPMSNPWTIRGDRKLLSSPVYDWEGWINEGPTVLQNQGKTYIVYSANSTSTPDYCLGLLVNLDDDYYNPASWRKVAEPVFQKQVTSEGAIYCTGHCSFVKSPDSAEDWILYHTKETTEETETRRARSQKFTWDAESGLPVFGTPVLGGVTLLRPSGEHQFTVS